VDNVRGKNGRCLRGKPHLAGKLRIGPTRIIGTLAEIYGDEKGLSWPKSVAPYKVHLLALNNQEESVLKRANMFMKVY